MAKEAAAIELIFDLVRGRTDGISKVDYAPQKPLFPDGPAGKALPRTSPESEGIASARIEGLLRALKESKTLHMHAVMILKNGNVIGEASFYPYQKELWHMTYSMAKSVVSMAVGFLVSEGKLSLDTHIVDIFKKKLGLLGMIRQKDLTVEHLLTMTSGVAFNEMGSVSGNDWLKGFLEAPVHHGAGESFEYNSMNTYVLSAIVTEVTGETLLDYLTPRLFEPLGITKVFWESCPKGINKGGWGLFLTIEDMAKLGQMYLDHGRWEGRQVIPEGWVEASATSKVVPPEETGFSGYGYQIWMCGRPGSFAFNGMMGQNVFVYPDVDMVLVTTAGNEEFFNSNALQEVMETYLPKEGEGTERLPEDRNAYERLKRLQESLSKADKPSSALIRGGGWKRRKLRAEEWQKQAQRLAGKRYVLDAVYAGLFPLMGQVFHNNYTQGIRELGFGAEQGEFLLEILEGETLHRLPIGFGDARYTSLDFHGEPYAAAVSGRFARDEDGQLVLAVTVFYLEDAMKRLIKIRFQEERILVSFDEVPGKRIILDGLASLTDSVMERPLFRRLREKGNVDLVKVLMERTIEPVIEGREKTGDAEQKFS